MRSADLARALGHGHQHDVHDADAADEQRHRRDRGEQQRHDPGRFLPCREQFREVAHGEVVVLRRAARRWRWRSSARMSASTSSRSAPSRSLSDTEPTLRSFTRLPADHALRAVVIGMRITSSWSVAMRSLPLRLQHADHRERHLANADRPRRPDRSRRTAAAQRYRRAAHLCAPSRPRPSKLCGPNRPVAHFEVLRRRPHRTR